MGRTEGRRNTRFRWPSFFPPSSPHSSFLPSLHPCVRARATISLANTKRADVVHHLVAHKLVIVARKDLKLSAGKLAAQVGHAAVDCALKAKRHQPNMFDAWYAEGQKKVVVKADDERALFDIKLAAERLGLTTALIADAGHTELAPGTITVLGVGPARDLDVDKVTGKLPLY